MPTETVGVLKDFNMSNEEQREALEAQLAELKAIAEKQLSPEPKSWPMDENDKLKLENLLLRERLAERDAVDARNALHAQMVTKYSINTALQIISMDANAGTISVTNKS